MWRVCESFRDEGISENLNVHEKVSQMRDSLTILSRKRCIHSHMRMFVAYGGKRESPFNPQDPGITFC